MQEAMSQGLPLIITPNTGGSDLIVEGKTGFLIPIRYPEKIAEKLDWFYENRSFIPVMAQNSIEYSQKYTWENYGNSIANELARYLESKS
jgi:glycosyltransferase involved in cell wall biosynthesis